jgi:phosphoglycolate phosphatase-like HAD superfamily hydrolase
MIIDQLLETKLAFVFDFDNTLYPEKDYLYQVYYMIGQFVEYQETFDHDIITKFLTDEFEANGREKLFDKLIEKFNLKEEYKENMLRLLRTGRLPLKLLLFKEMEWIMNEVVNNNRLLFLLTNGNVEQQRNKIVQVEWNGLQKNLRCYFANEIKPKPAPDALQLLMEEHALSPEDVVFIGDSKVDEECAKTAGVDFYYVKNLVAGQ